MQQFETNEKIQVQKTYVALRLRPIQSHEKFCEKVSNTQIRIRQPNSNTFQFGNISSLIIQNKDRVFDENEDTQVVFDQMVQPMLDKSLCGFNALICAYGQTSSGKTYTMKGCAQSQGLIQYSAKHLFNQISKYKGSKITMQYLEIYQEQIYDLLSHDKEMKSLKNKFYCQQVEIKTPNQLLEYQQFILLINFFYKNSKFGEDKRHFGETSMNIESSRSHVILELILSVPVHEGKAVKRRESKVLFVDLAGSEGATKDFNTVRKQEGSKINKSLLAFCNVVNRIKENQVTGKDEYINYRDSQLTVCLKTCLEGNSQLGFLFTINQNMSNSAQSLTTIQFSKNAGAIKSELIVNEVISENSGEFDKRVRELTEENQQLNEQIENQEKNIQQLKEQIEVQNNSLRASEKVQNELKGKIKQLTFNINTQEKEIRQLKDWNQDFVNQKDSFEKKIALLEKQQQRQNIAQQKENVEPVCTFNNKPLSKEEIKNDVNKGNNIVIKQVKLFQDESQGLSLRAQAQQSKRQSATFPALLTPQKEKSQIAEKSKQMSPSISELSDYCSLYIEIRTQKLRNFFLQEQLVDMLQENLKLQKQNADYDKLLKHKLYEEEDFGDMQQFYENMEIAPEQQKKPNKQIQQPRMSQQQSTYEQTMKMLDNLKLNYKSSTIYVEQLFKFMEVTYGQDRMQLSKQFAEFTKEQILLNQ